MWARASWNLKATIDTSAKIVIPLNNVFMSVPFLQETPTPRERHRGFDRQPAGRQVGALKQPDGQPFVCFLLHLFPFSIEDVKMP